MYSFVFFSLNVIILRFIYAFMPQLFIPFHCKVFFHCMYVLLLLCCLVAKLYSTLCNPMDCSPPGFSIHGIFQAKVLKWGATAFSENTQENLTQINMMV